MNVASRMASLKQAALPLVSLKAFYTASWLLWYVGRKQHAKFKVAGAVREIVGPPQGDC